MSFVLLTTLLASAMVTPSGGVHHRPALPSDTLAWVGSQAITTADLIRRVEFMPFAGNADVDPPNARRHALESLVGETLLAQEAQQRGLLDDPHTARSLRALERALLRDALYRSEVDAKVEIPAVPKVAQGRRGARAGSPTRAAARDSVTQARAQELASALMTRVLAGKRAAIDRGAFLQFADSLRMVVKAAPPNAVTAPRGNSTAAPSGSQGHAITNREISILEARLGPHLDRVLVRLPGDSLRLGDVLADFGFYRFMVKSVDREGFRIELNQALHRVVEGDLLAAEARRRRLDRSAELKRDLAMWSSAQRADGLAHQIAGREQSADSIARHIARLADAEDARIDYAALQRAQILPSNMLTRRTLGFGGSMLAAPTLSPDWDWVPIWRAAHPALP